MGRNDVTLLFGGVHNTTAWQQSYQRLSLTKLNPNPICIFSPSLPRRVIVRCRAKPLHIMYILLIPFHACISLILWHQENFRRIFALTTYYYILCAPNLDWLVVSMAWCFYKIEWVNWLRFESWVDLKVKVFCTCLFRLFWSGLWYVDFINEHIFSLSNYLIAAFPLRFTFSLVFPYIR